MKSTNEIIDFYTAEPAPLLPILHLLQERDGYITEESIRTVSESLHIPHAELYGTITFYHYFRTKEPQTKHYYCDGPACVIRSDYAPNEQSDPIACPGRCDTQHITFPDGFEISNVHPSEPLPPAQEQNEECLFTHIRTKDRSSISGYQRTNGYQALEICKKNPSQAINIIKDSGLAGRGGAGFPTGTKWEMVANEQRSPKYIIVNADEGEPGCFKDRVLMEHDPHALIEGMAIAGLCTGAKTGIIYLRYEYPQCIMILQQAIDEASQAGHLDHMSIYIRRGAGAYICGEETSLLNSLEGKRPFPREKPPFPTTHGFMNQPTVINNVETLCAIAPIITKGAKWYQDLGLGESAGTKIFSVSGDVKQPGNYEVPLGTPLKTLIEQYCGGITEGHTFKAATMAGISGGFLSADHYDIPLDVPSVAKAGSMLGAGGIIVYHDGRSMREAAHHCMKFFADESCGKCFPCRIGTTRLTEMLHLKKKGTQQDMNEICDVMSTLSACGLGLAAPIVVTSFMQNWSDEIDG